MIRGKFIVLNAWIRNQEKFQTVMKASPKETWKRRANKTQSKPRRDNNDERTKKI